MSEREATKRPWRFVPWHIAEGAAEVRAGTSPFGEIICTTASDANAALIARAVNSHDEARELLREALFYVQRTNEETNSDHSERLLARIGAFLGRKW